MNLYKFPKSLRRKWQVILVVGLMLILIAAVSLLRSSSMTDSSTSGSSQNQVSQPNQTNQNFPDSQPNQNEIYQPPQLQEAISQQSQVDQDYADWQESSRTNYPWRKHLPLYTESYYVYFDMSNQIFIALLYPKVDDNISQMKTDISNTLYNWGVNLEDYQFEWRVSTK